jgi:hypothetical protein
MTDFCKCYSGENAGRVDEVAAAIAHTIISQSVNAGTCPKVMLLAAARAVRYVEHFATNPEMYARADGTSNAQTLDELMPLATREHAAATWDVVDAHRKRVNEANDTINSIVAMIEGVPPPSAKH